MPPQFPASSREPTNLNHNNLHPLKPHLARTAHPGSKTPLTPRLATTTSSSRDKPASNTSRAGGSSGRGTHSPSPASTPILSHPVDAAVRSPLLSSSLLGNNVTPRSSARKSRVDSAQSTPGGTPTQSTAGGGASTVGTLGPTAAVGFRGKEGTPESAGVGNAMHGGIGLRGGLAGGGAIGHRRPRSVVLDRGSAAAVISTVTTGASRSGASVVGEHSKPGGMARAKTFGGGISGEGEGGGQPARIGGGQLQMSGLVSSPNCALDDRDARFFHASDAERRNEHTSRPPLKKKSSFVYANGESESKCNPTSQATTATRSHQLAPRAPSPAMSGVSTRSRSRTPNTNVIANTDSRAGTVRVKPRPRPSSVITSHVFSHTNIPPTASTSPTSYRVPLSTSTAKSNTSTTSKRSIVSPPPLRPTPHKAQSTHNIHLSYRKGASQVLSPTSPLRPRSIPGLPSSANNGLPLRRSPSPGGLPGLGPPGRRSSSLESPLDSLPESLHSHPAHARDNSAGSLDSLVSSTALSVSAHPPAAVLDPPRSEPWSATPSSRTSLEGMLEGMVAAPERSWTASPTTADLVGLASLPQSPTYPSTAGVSRPTSHPLPTPANSNHITSHSASDQSQPTPILTQLPATSSLTSLAAEARRERKVLDLEISNSSLLAINRQLEREVRRQRGELRRFRRLSRAGGFGLARRREGLGVGFVGGGGESSDEESGAAEDWDGGSSWDGSGDEMDDSEMEGEGSDESSEFSMYPALDRRNDQPQSSIPSPHDISATGTTKSKKRSRNPKLRADQRRLTLDLRRHQALLRDSQKMNLSIKRCLAWTDGLIDEARRALEYSVRVSDVRLGGRVLEREELEDDAAGIAGEGPEADGCEAEGGGEAELSGKYGVDEPNGLGLRIDDVEVEGSTLMDEDGSVEEWAPPKLHAVLTRELCAAQRPRTPDMPSSPLESEPKSATPLGGLCGTPISF